MKKIIFRTIAFFLLAIIIIIGYVSLIGIETSRFNNQISEQLKSVDKDLDLELKKVKILTLNSIQKKILKRHHLSHQHQLSLIQFFLFGFLA